jgi:pimeloyl-ACP methyl ester carboxylesterase
MDAPRPLSPLGLLRQSRGLLELPRLLWEFPDLARQPRGRGEPVLVLPGYGAGDASTLVLQGFLRFLGYRVCGWALGRNTGEVPVLLPRVVQRVTEVAREAEQSVRLVGWSLGGYLAREAARERPDIVEQVITLGTPTVGGPKYTAVAGVYRRRGVDLDAIEAAVDARNRTPLEVPVTAIYSRSDGVVAWKACIDRINPNVNHIEVRTTHLGLGFAPEVYRIIAESLGRGSDGERSPSA